MTRRLLVSGLVALCAALVLGFNLPAPAAAQSLSEVYTQVGGWRSAPSPTGAGAFRNPEGVAVAADGTIYVADKRLHAVHILAPDGTPKGILDGQTVAGGGAALDLGPVQDVALGNPYIYVSDPDGARVHVFTPDGMYQTSWSVPEGPFGLAWADDELYVTVVKTASVLVLGAGAVLDTASNGRVQRRWATPVISMTQPSRPYGIDVGRGNDKRVFVTDLGNDNVPIFDRQGTLVDTMSSMVDGVTQEVLDVAVDASGEVYLLSEYFIVRNKGGLILNILRTPGGRGIAAGPGSGLTMTVQDSRLGFTGVRIIQDRRAQDPIHSDPKPVDRGAPFAPLGTFERPRRVSANTDGWVYLVDSWPRIQGFQDDGTPKGQFTTGVLHDVAAGRRGSVYGIDGSHLAYWAIDGTPLWTWQPPSTNPSAGKPYGWLVAADSFGNDLAVLDAGDQHVYMIDFSANALSEWPIVPDTSFESVSDLALATNNLYLVNRTRRAVEVRNRTDGAVTGRWTVPGRAWRIDVGADESVYVLTEAGWVWKYRPDGTAVAAWQVATDRAAVDLTVGAGGRVYVTYSDTQEVKVFGIDPNGAPGNVPPLEEKCNLKPAKTANPTDLELGDKADIELKVTGDCPLSDVRNDVMLLVDTSGSMSGPKMAAARTAALEFVGQLDYSLDQVGLISFSTNVKLVQGLTSNPRDLIRAIPDLGDDSGTNMLDAVVMANDEFVSPRARPEARKVIILLTDGQPNSGAELLLAYAQEYRATGRAIYAIGLGLDVDRNFLQAMVSDPSFYFDAPTEYDLSRIFDAVARRVSASALLAQVTVTDQLPANMRLVPNSVVPPARWSSVTSTLIWDVSSVPPGGLSLRYRVQPLEVGDWPTNVSAVADYVDGVHYKGQLVFPVPHVVVKQTIKPHWEAYLPFLLRQKCQEVLTDVVLVLDTSTSMLNPVATGGHQTKLEAAIQGSRVFMSQLHLPADNVALVAFNGTATLVQPLTGNQIALVKALDHLPLGSGTRIDLGLGAAIDALAAHGPGRVPVIVLLTDGEQSGAPVATAVAAGLRARQAGIFVFTIGVGSGADLALLAQLAGDPRRAYSAASEENLGAIYREIAGAIPCQ